MRIKKLIFIATLFFALSFTAFAQSAVVISENANLRGTANQNGKVVTVLSSGTSVEVIKQSGAWFLVQSDTYVGWIHGNNIKFTNYDVRNFSSSQKEISDYISGGWYLITQSKDEKTGTAYYYKPGSVKTDILRHRKAWIRVVPIYPPAFIKHHKLPANMAYYEMLFTANCNDERYSTESIVLYDKNGDFVKSKGFFSTSFYQPVIPKTTHEHIYQKLCYGD